MNEIKTVASHPPRAGALAVAQLVATLLLVAGVFVVILRIQRPEASPAAPMTVRPDSAETAVVELTGALTKFVDLYAAERAERVALQAALSKALAAPATTGAVPGSPPLDAPASPTH